MLPPYYQQGYCAKTGRNQNDETGQGECGATTSVVGLVRFKAIPEKD
jgi:hypothetical protein